MRALLPLAPLLLAAAACGDPACEWEPPGPEVVGTCQAILGWYHDGGSCRNLSGCSCTAPECEVPFASEEECVAACGDG